MKKISRSEKETQKIAGLFLNKILKGGKQPEGALVVCLSGELGAGKTVFVRAVAKHLRVKSKIASPTFVIMKKHPLKHKEYKFLFHLDAYRLKNIKELQHLKWDEIIGSREHLVFIEWPENITKAIPTHAQFVRISHTPEGHRRLEW